MTTLSPWDRGSVERLRPSPRKALILADFHVDMKTAVNETVPQLERDPGTTRSRPPVRATQTGFATLSRAIQDESIAAAERGELIALPFLLIVLLLVFRSPIAAAIPLAFGAITVIASRGILYFFTSWFDIDAFALTVCTMMGLALGVDYALLMVSRFREELAGGSRAARGGPARPAAPPGGRRSSPAAPCCSRCWSRCSSCPGSLLVSLAGTVAMVVDPQRRRGDRGRPGDPDPGRDQRRSLADRRRTAGGRSRLMTFVNGALQAPGAGGGR